MKKFGFTLLMGLVCLSVSAEGRNDSEKKWDGSINKAKLTKYLQLSDTQHSQVANICDFFQEQMKTANSARVNNDEKVRNAVYGNLNLMKKTLDDKQYSEYVRLMALTLRNKGLNIEHSDLK